jgi:hypothetical protein|tara:strand:- start:1420 stop:1881 length:462 start_codon:yes stop_codon:yes gene_type:complete
MADAATVVMKTTILPDEIAKTIEATTTVSPKDANDKWYYKLTSVTAASTDLITGYYTDYTAVNANANPGTVATGDKVEFIYIKNTDAANDIYVVFNAGTVANTTTDAVKISPNQSFYGRYPNATVADVHAIGHDGSSAATATCIVCALLDDIA